MPNADWGDFQYGAGSETGIIVHVFDKYYHDAEKGVTYYLLTDGDVLANNGPDPAVYGFIMTQGSVVGPTGSINEKWEWVDYDTARKPSNKRPNGVPKGNRPRSIR